MRRPPGGVRRVCGGCWGRVTALRATGGTVGVVPPGAAATWWTGVVGAVVLGPFACGGRRRVSGVLARLLVGCGRRLATAADAWIESELMGTPGRRCCYTLMSSSDFIISE